MKYILYATGNNGDGYVQQIGEYENIEDIEIRISMFASDVVISFDIKKDEEN